MAVVALLLATVLAELGLRRVLHDQDAYRIWSPGLEKVFHPAPDVMPGITGPSRFEISSLGFRADERPARPEPAVLALGGSTTECLYLDQEEAWPARLQELLRKEGRPSAWVANGGKSGRTARDHVVQLRHLLAQPPRFDAVLLLAGVNDLTGRLSEVPLPLEESEALARAFDVVPLAVEDGPLWKRTALGRLLATARDSLSPDARAQDDAGAIYTTWRARRRDAGAWRAELPDLTGALQEYGNALGEIASLCEAASVRLVLVTQPAVWAPDLPEAVEARLWLGGVGAFQDVDESEYYETSALARGMARYNERLLEVAAQRDLESVDLAHELGSDPELFYDDVHFNERGAERVAEILAEVFR